MRKKILFIYNEGLIIRDIEKGELIFTEQVFINLKEGRVR